MLAIGPQNMYVTGFKNSTQDPISILYWVYQQVCGKLLIESTFDNRVFVFVMVSVCDGLLPEGHSEPSQASPNG